MNEIAWQVRSIWNELQAKSKQRKSEESAITLSSLLNANQDSYEVPRSTRLSDDLSDGVDMLDANKLLV